MGTIMIADDEPRIREVARLYLEADGFSVLEAEDGLQVLEQLKHQTIDLLVLDLMMPNLDGWTVCKLIRKQSNVPVIMLTAKGSEADRILGFELGADDYLVKPFSPRELIARVKAVIRRTESEKKPEEVIIYPGLKIDLITREVEVDGAKINLTIKEYELLLYLVQNPGRAFSRDNLMDSVWGYDYYGDSRTVDTHINRLRPKLKKDFIQTVRGVGYKFDIG